MNKESVKRVRIFLLFFAGIIIPSLIMGYLAFRGIQNDRALLEKQRIQEDRRLARMAAKEAGAALSRVEESFLSFLNRADASRSDLRGFRDSHSEVEEIFIFKEGAGIMFPAAELPFGSLADSADYSPEPGSLLFSLLNSAEKLEFQDENFSEAGDMYKEAFQRAESLATKGRCLSAAARTLRKSGKTGESAALYTEIADKYGGCFTSLGIPLAFAALRERGAIYAQSKSSEQALNDYLEAYRRLLHPQWRLTRNGFETLSADIQSAVQYILNHGKFDKEETIFRELKAREKNLIVRTERLLLFQETAPQLLSSPSIEGAYSQRRVLYSAGDSYLVSIFNDAGIIYHRERLCADLIYPAVEKHLSGENVKWTIRGYQDQAILPPEFSPSGEPDMEAELDSVFPGWNLALYHSDPSMLESFVSNPGGIYFYMFLLIGGILAFGLVLTIRLVNRELELARMKSNFVSTVSHEFKSPLTSIRQLSEMLHAGRVPSEERKQKYYDVLLKESERLSLLTENVLNFSRMEEGRKRFVFEKTNIGNLLRDIAAGFRDRLRSENFTIALDIGPDLPEVSIDRDSFRQAVNNLIDNAVKYSGPSKRAVIRLRKQEGHLTVSVQDFGEGISPAEQKHIFDRFYRGGRELTRKVKGSGLGLTLVKQILTAHKGRIGVESLPGEGSTFTLWVPLKNKKEKT